MLDTFKFLVCAAAVMFIAQAGAQIYRDTLAVQLFRIERDAIAIEAARNALEQERMMAAQNVRSQCWTMRSLAQSYAQGARQRPGMTSWNDARLYIEKNCDTI